MDVEVASEVSGEDSGSDMDAPLIVYCEGPLGNSTPRPI